MPIYIREIGNKLFYSFSTNIFPDIIFFDSSQINFLIISGFPDETGG